MQDVLPALLSRNLLKGNEFVHVVTKEGVERFLLPGDLFETFIKLGLAFYEKVQAVTTQN